MNNDLEIYVWKMFAYVVSQMKFNAKAEYHWEYFENYITCLIMF